MRKWKYFVMIGTMAVSLSSLAGCADNDGINENGNRGRRESIKDDDDDKNGVNEVKEMPEEEDPKETPDTPDEVYGFDSTEEVINAYWRAFDACNRDAFTVCFLSEEKLGRSAYKKMTEIIDDQMDISEKSYESITIHLGEISIDAESMDPEDLSSHITALIDVDEAEISTVCVPMTQDINGTICEVNDNYEITTICVDGRWYIDSLNSLGAEIVSTEAGNTSNAGGTDSDRANWGTFTVTNDGISSIYSNGIEDSFELAEGVTFGDLCDTFEETNADFNRETYRQVFTLTFGPDIMYDALMDATQSEKAHVFACMAEIAHTIDKVEGNATEMELDVNDPENTVYWVSCKTYGDCVLYVSNSTNDMKLVQPKTGNESEGTMKDEDIAVWEEEAMKLLD